ncbi:MAG: hypothetical protein GTN99_04555, partial [Candidatus Dadabacteria bacterium]|nr:hypothetical protein [Candidatus Dadabacteria bacterium]
MAKSKKRPVRRNRRVNRVKKNKGKRVLFATISFIAVVLLSLVALQYLNKNIQRDTGLNRISQDELSEEIEKIDDKLNKIFADIDLRRNEIISKEVDKRAIDDINWEYKQVSIKTDEAQKIKKFNDGLERLARLDNVEVDVNKSNDLTISTLSLY